MPAARLGSTDGVLNELDVGNPVNVFATRGNIVYHA